MDNIQEQLNDFLDDSFLQKKLDFSMGGTGEGVAILIQYRGKQSVASINGFSPRDLVQIGCLAKSLTATLIAVAQSEGRLQLDSRITDFFSSFSFGKSLKNPLDKIKIYHLLNHSNGFDNALLEAVIKNNKGMIDGEGLLNSLDGGVILPPSEIFNYNSIGPWLAASILEHVYQRPYSELLEEYLLQPLGVKEITTRKGGNICPSIGQDILLSADDLLKIACLHLDGDQNRPELLEHLLTLRSRFSVAIPQWLPAGRLCYPGWFDFGGSYGQLGYGANSAGVIRFLPEYGAAIVVTATHQKLANTTLGMVFKDVFKDFENSFLPQLLNADEWKGVGTEMYEGTYENAKYSLLIDTASNGSLRGKVFRRSRVNSIHDTEPYIKRYFKGADGHLFLPTQPEQLVCPVLAFSHPNKNRQFQIISTNAYIFSRVA